MAVLEDGRPSSFLVVIEPKVFWLDALALIVHRIVPEVQRADLVVIESDLAIPRRQRANVQLGKVQGALGLMLQITQRPYMYVTPKQLRSAFGAKKGKKIKDLLPKGRIADDEVDALALAILGAVKTGMLPARTDYSRNLAKRLKISNPRSDRCLPTHWLKP